MIQNCANNNWENIAELVPAGGDVDEYRRIFTEGYVTCELSHIIGNLYDMIFRYRSIPIQLCKHPTHASNLNCNTMFAREGGLNQRNFETNIGQLAMPQHILQCMYIYLTENFIPQLHQLGTQGPRHSAIPDDVPPGVGGGGPPLTTPRGPSAMLKECEWANLEQKINYISSLM
jgi:hypothetical protein